MAELTSQIPNPGRALRAVQFGRLFRKLAWDRMGSRRDEPLCAAERLRGLCGELCSSHGLMVDVSGRFPRRPHIIVANHSSYVDPIVLGSLVSCSPIAKAELADWPFVGAVAQNYGVNFVRREDALSGAVALRRAASRLNNGVNVLNFPEGTTSATEVLPFRRGIFGVARQLNVPVVPVRIRLSDPALAWIGDDTFVPHYLQTLRGGPYQVRVVVGEPLVPAEYQSAERLAAKARGWVSEDLACPLP